MSDWDENERDEKDIYLLTNRANFISSSSNFIQS